MHDRHHKLSGSKQTDDPLDCVCFGLRSTARAVTRLYDEALKPCELKATQFTLLAHLAARAEVAFSSLKDELTMDQTTLTRNLRPLVRRNLVAVRPGPDRRTRVITLTPQGRQLYRQALPLWKNIQQQVTGNLGKTRWSHMQKDLDHLRRNVSA